MKKTLLTILSLAIVATMITTTSSAKDITVELDGKTIEFDVKPEIIDERTMVPLRKIFEEIGASVKWDGDTQTVSARKNSKTVTLTIGSTELQIDKGKTDADGNPIVETVTLDVPAQIVSERTLVPARAISESFGLTVDWNETDKKVIITSDDEKDDSWKENIGSIDLTKLTYEGNGIEINDNQIKITSGGDFTLTGTLKNGNITISTKEKVKLRLKDATITSAQEPCIFVEDADKVYITLSKDTKNYLVAENSKDGAIYSKENLEIKGYGYLDIQSLNGHGIKASDNLTIENGTLKINASSDGIHINDTFKMIGGNIDITAVGDGIDCESIVNISGGKINIETNGVPLENTETTANSETTPRRGMFTETPDVEFESSSKGINAEWMMVISGGEFNINSASHAIHCADETEISGGSFYISSKYDKGISAHGNLTIDGKDTVIDITKSTEGIESKKVLTINNGDIKVISSDDAINATGGNSGMMPPMGNFTPNGNPDGFVMPEGGFTPNGDRGNRVPPEGFENMGPNPQDMQNSANQQRPRPQRGENNGFTNPNFEMPEGFEFDPSQIPEDFKGGMGGGFMGGMGRDMKACLIINGGNLELCGNDDCVDANGTMVINGGTLKATNPTGSFSGNFGVLDADGQITISENANIILASSSGNEKSLNLSQNTIIVYCEKQHTAKEKLSVSDSNGNIIYEYAPEGNFKTILITSKNIQSGEKYLIKIGDESFEAQINGQSTVVGTQPTGGMGGFGRGPIMQ